MARTTKDNMQPEVKQASLEEGEDSLEADVVAQEQLETPSLCFHKDFA